jgi:hypothetical protein
MALFPDIVIPAPYRSKAQHDLRRVSLDLEYERRRASILKRAAATKPDLALKASAAEVLVAALQARAAQLRRSAGRPRLTTSSTAGYQDAGEQLNRSGMAATAGGGGTT